MPALRRSAEQQHASLAIETEQEEATKVEPLRSISSHASPHAHDEQFACLTRHTDVMYINVHQAERRSVLHASGVYVYHVVYIGHTGNRCRAGNPSQCAMQAPGTCSMSALRWPDNLDQACPATETKQNEATEG